MTSPLHNSSTRWAHVHLDRETERKAALETIVLLNAVKDQAHQARLHHRENELFWEFSFDQFKPEHIDFILATIGTGEVRISIDNGRVKLEETAIPALWHVQNGITHSLVLSIMPPAVGEAIDKINGTLKIPNETPEKVFSAPSILLELQAVLEKTNLEYFTHDPAFSIELTRQPLESQDRDFLEGILGVGSIEIWLSGFASAHIRSTTVRGLWNSRLLNNAGKLLLDSIVVARIPPEVPTAPEELDDTVKIASETLHWIEQDLERGALG